MNQRSPFVFLLYGLLLGSSTAVVQGSPIDSHLANVRDLFLQLKEPGYFYWSENYALLKRMQQECDEADRHYAMDFTGSEARTITVLDATVRMHILMGLAGAAIGYEDFYEYHLETAYRRFRRHYGYSEAQKAVESSLQGYQLKPGLFLDQLFKEKVAEYEDYRNKGKRVELVFERSSNLFPLEQFSVKAVPEENASPRALLFARSLDLQLSDPVIKHWYLKYYLEQARQRRLNIEPTDYFIEDPADAEKAQWVSEIPRDFRTRNPIALSVVIPDGRYYVFPRGQSVTDVEPNLVIDSGRGLGADRYVLTMLESGTRAEVRAESPGAPQVSARQLIPTFKMTDLHVGLNEKTGNLEGSFAARTFHRLHRNIAFQTQAEFSVRSHFEYSDLDRLIPFQFQPREKRPVTDYASSDFQFDLGPVIRYRDFQFALMQSLRYVNRERFDRGGVLGQFMFNFNYLFQHGQAGFYFTKASLDEPVVQTVQFDQVFFEETYLKVLDQVGVNFQVDVFENSYVEGSFGYLNSTLRQNTLGGVVRHVLPPLWKKMRLTYEIGFNESFVSPKDAWRIGFGLRFGDWIKPAAFQRAEGPVPVFVPRVKYETLTRVVRRGNRAPVANAGPDQDEVRPGTKVVLDGTHSFDPDGDPITYEWTQLSGEPVVLEDRNTSTPRFIAGNGQVYVFQLMVTDSQGARSAPDVVVVKTLKVELPVIVLFRADPPEIRTGQSSVLQFEARNAVRVRITGIDGDLPVQGEVTVRPSSTTTYTMTAYNVLDESISATTTVVVKPPLPVIVTFRADPEEIRLGATSTLSWKTVNASRVVLINVGQEENVPTEGTLKVQPASTTTYNLVAYNEAGETVSARITVTVRPLVPVVESFKAEPSEIRAGGSSTLSWKTRNASRVTLSVDGGPEQDVAGEGSQVVRPARTATYTITAYNTIGERSSASVTVTVRLF